MHHGHLYGDNNKRFAKALEDVVSEGADDFRHLIKRLERELITQIADTGISIKGDEFRTDQDGNRCLALHLRSHLLEILNRDYGI